MTIISNIIRQHAEEVAFLWFIRDRAVGRPDFNISDLASLDCRINVNIDGLNIAGDDGWVISKEVLNFNEAGDFFTTAVCALNAGNMSQIDSLMNSVNEDPVIFRGIISAFGWLSYSKIEKILKSLFVSESTFLVKTYIAVLDIHRHDPGRILNEGIISKDATLKERTLKAVGELGKTEFAPSLQDFFEADDEKCRFYAAWSSGLLGSTAGVPVLQALGETEGPYAERACVAALRRIGVAEGIQWQRALAGKEKFQRMAVIGAGAIGDPVLIPWLIEHMAVPELARVAGESFSMITGVDLAYEDLEGEWPEGFEAGPTENPEDEDVEMDPDEDLPWPEHALIQDWWHKNKTNFKSGVRHLCGKPITEQQCQHVLRYGYQRQRAAAAMELAMLRPGQPLFNVEAPGWRQQKLLGLKSHL